LTPLGSNNWAVTTIAGTAGVNGSTDGTNNAARFYWPSDLSVDGSGNIYVADTYNHTIRAGTPVSPLPPIPSLAAMNRTTNGFGFSWNAVPGLWYQVQYKTDLLQGNWMNLGGSTLATNSPMPFVDSAPADSERSYRVVVLP
jgi:hypothetical protein